jgi:hypothetical protein
MSFILRTVILKHKIAFHDINFVIYKCKTITHPSNVLLSFPHFDISFTKYFLTLDYKQSKGNNKLDIIYKKESMMFNDALFLKDWGVFLIIEEKKV